MDFKWGAWLEKMMELFFKYLIPVVIGLVSIALVLGLINMAKGGSSSYSQSLMRWRVGLQFAAIFLVMLSLYITG